MHRNPWKHPDPPIDNLPKYVAKKINGSSYNWKVAQLKFKFLNECANLIEHDYLQHTDFFMLSLRPEKYMLGPHFVSHMPPPLTLDGTVVTQSFPLKRGKG